MFHTAICPVLIFSWQYYAYEHTVGSYQLVRRIVALIKRHAVDICKIDIVLYFLPPSLKANIFRARFSCIFKNFHYFSNSSDVGYVVLQGYR